jgi:hypothetical protein
MARYLPKADKDSRSREPTAIRLPRSLSQIDEEVAAFRAKLFAVRGANQSAGGRQSDPQREEYVKAKKSTGGPDVVQKDNINRWVGRGKVMQHVNRPAATMHRDSTPQTSHAVNAGTHRGPIPPSNDKGAPPSKNCIGIEHKEDGQLNSKARKSDPSSDWFESDEDDKDEDDNAGEAEDNEPTQEETASGKEGSGRQGRLKIPPGYTRAKARRARVSLLLTILQVP